MEYRIKPQSFIAPAGAGLIVWFILKDLNLGLAVFAVLLMPAIIKVYIPYAKDNPEHYWFKRKLYRWGWMPVTWQGWVSILLYVGLIVLLLIRLDESATVVERLASFVIPAVAISMAFFWLALKKGESPKWQWGRKDKE